MHSEWGRGLVHSKGIFNWRREGQVKRLEEDYTVQGKDIKIPREGIIMTKGGGFNSWKNEWNFSSKNVDRFPLWLNSMTYKELDVQQKKLLSDKVTNSDARGEGLKHKQNGLRILTQANIFVI